MELLEVEPLNEFLDALPNPITRRKYERRLDIFLRFTNMEGKDVKARARAFVILAKADPTSATILINDYMRTQRERGERKEISINTIPGYYRPIRLLCEMNDIVLNWRKISRRFPKGSSHGQDRPPLPDEIKAILGYGDRRIKPAILTLVSSGVRVGAFDYLNVGHVEALERGGELKAGKLTVYAGEAEQYVTFITPEAYRAIQEYLDYRRSVGEKVTKDSPLVRDLIKGDRLGRGEPHIARRCTGLLMSHLVWDALKAGNLRKGLEEGKRRYEFQGCHGFRKYFKTVCERQMKSLDVELLLGHSVGLGDNYYRPSLDELLDDYLLAVPELTVLETVKPESQSIQELRKKIAELEGQGALAAAETVRLKRELAKRDEGYTSLEKKVLDLIDRVDKMKERLE